MSLHAHLHHLPMENSSNVSTTTTTGRPAQLPVSLSHTHTHPSPTLAHHFVALFGSQNQPESTTIRIEVSKFSSGGSVAATQTTGQLIIPMGENEQEHPTSENVLPDIENHIESTATSMENPDNDSSNHPPIATMIATTPHTALLHDYSNPKIATYFVGVYPTFIALVSLKFIAEKYNTPFDTHIPFMIVSIVAYLMAILDLAILFCLYDRLKRPSNQHFSPGHYKILTYVFHILWILAILSVVPVLFTPQR